MLEVYVALVGVQLCTTYTGWLVMFCDILAFGSSVV